MPRKAQPPSYPKRPHAASGQARVKIKGKHQYLGPWGSPASHERHRQLVAAWTPDGDSALTTHNRPVTIAEVVCGFLEHANRTMLDRHGKPKKERLHFKRLTTIVLDVAAKLPAAQFRDKQLRSSIDAMVAAAWCRKHVNRSMVRIRRIFRWAESEEMVPVGTWNHLRTVRGLAPGQATDGGAVPDDWGDVPPAPEADIARALPKLGRIVRAMVELQLLTGARPGEIMGLRAGDIDRSSRVWVAQLTEHKTAWRGHRRFILFGPKAQAILKPFLQRAADAYLFSPREAFEESLAARRTRNRAPKRNPKRQRPPGEVYQNRSYNWAIERACRRAGVPKFSPHQLRHNAASRIAAEFDPETARLVLGHRDLAVTRGYIQDNLSKAIEAMARAG